MNQKSIIFSLLALSLSISTMAKGWHFEGDFKWAPPKFNQEDTVCQKAIKSAGLEIVNACEDAEVGEIVNFKQCKTAIREVGLPAVKTCLKDAFGGESEEIGRAGKFMALVEAFAMEMVMPLVEAGMEMPLHGNYCGPNYGDAAFSDNPIDELDTVCMLHDRCYVDHGQFDCDCDEEMIRDIVINLREGNFQGEQYFKALGSMVYFTLAKCTERNADAEDSN